MSDDNVVVTIFGTEHAIKSDADPAYIREVAAYVDGKMRESAARSSVKAGTTVAVLAALNIADELFREREDDQLAQRELETKLVSLCERLDEEIIGDDGESLTEGARR